MCIIIYSPNGEFPKKHLANSLRNNSDGWGIMWPTEEGKVNIVKGMKSEEFFFQWKSWIRAIKAPKVFHARIGTHGVKDTSNCHPFVIPQHENVAMCHNGIIKQQEDEGDASDTLNFINNILQYMPKQFYASQPFCELIEEYIGHSKLVFMEGGGDTYIINENLGHWEGGRWYSNHSHMSYTGSYTGGTSWSKTTSGTWVQNKMGFTAGGTNSYVSNSDLSFRKDPVEDSPLVKNIKERLSGSSKDLDMLSEEEWRAQVVPASIIATKQKAAPLTGGDGVFMSASEFKAKLREQSIAIEEANSEEVQRICDAICGGRADELSDRELHLYNLNGGALATSEKARVAKFRKSIAWNRHESPQEEYPCQLPNPEEKYDIVAI